MPPQVGSFHSTDKRKSHPAFYKFWWRESSSFRPVVEFKLILKEQDHLGRGKLLIIHITTYITHSKHKITYCSALVSNVTTLLQTLGPLSCLSYELFHLTHVSPVLKIGLALIFFSEEGSVVPDEMLRCVFLLVRFRLEKIHGCMCRRWIGSGWRCDLSFCW